MAVVPAAVLAAACAGCLGGGGRAAAPAAGLQRTCASAVHGTLPSGWRRSAVFMGPLVLWTFGAIERDGSFSDTFPVRKVLVLVRPRATVTLSVPRSARGRFGLLYRPGAARHADPSVTFHACPPSGGAGYARWTQFNGGFVARRRQCVAVTAARRRLTLSIGAGRCG